MIRSVLADLTRFNPAHTTAGTGVFNLQPGALADGLSALAVNRHALALMDGGSITPALTARRGTLAPIVIGRAGAVRVEMKWDRS